LGESREPGPFFAPQVSKEFLGKGALGLPEQIQIFGLDRSVRREPVIFRTIFQDVQALSESTIEPAILGRRQAELDIGTFTVNSMSPPLLTIAVGLSLTIKSSGLTTCCVALNVSIPIT